MEVPWAFISFGANAIISICAKTIEYTVWVQEINHCLVMYTILPVCRRPIRGELRRMLQIYGRGELIYQTWNLYPDGNRRSLKSEKKVTCPHCGGKGKFPEKPEYSVVPLD